MTATIKRSPYLAPRSEKAYRLELEGRTIFLLLALFIFSGVVIFALGVTTGMGMREPGGELPLAALPADITAAGQEAQPAEEALTFNEGVRAPVSTIEGLRLTEQKASDQTQSLLERAEKELKLEEIPTSQPLPGRADATGGGDAKRGRSNQPAVKGPSSPSPAEGQVFTVQVFSSRRRTSAGDLLAKLKKLGFAAYMNQFQGPSRETWYRIRVGKTTRKGAERLVTRLQEEAGLKAPRIIQQ